MSKFIAPALNKSSFHCPHCGVLAAQTWSYRTTSDYQYKTSNGSTYSGSFDLANFTTVKCNHCQGIAIWLKKQMIYPLTGNVELPNDDLSDDIKNDYNEAKSIVNLSPKGASALLRLAIQKLCIGLGEKGKNINDDIASLVKKGLPIQVQQALDIVRVTGNHAVHPGTIEDDDRSERALALFGLINIIANHFITQPNMIASLYGNLPEKDRANIEKRDS